MSGKVYLIGAGPGDGGLITAKGREMIRTADVVVYDRLVGCEIMDLIPADWDISCGRPSDSSSDSWGQPSYPARCGGRRRRTPSGRT